MKILIIEDDPLTGIALLDCLVERQYGVKLAIDGETGLQLAQAEDYDLVLLDVVLPKLDGITVCRQLRTQGYENPILLLTAKDSSSDRVLGLDAGADDYVVKPFDLPELLARIRALLRRGKTGETGIICWETLRFDSVSSEVSCGDRILHLTPKEYCVLELFLLNPKRVFSRSAILDRLWDFAESPGEETVSSHIYSLRQKIKATGSNDLIETVHGVGYRLKAPKFDHTDCPIESPKQSQFLPIDISSKLAKTWVKFQPKISDQIMILEKMVNALVAGSLSKKQQEQAEQTAHKLVGSLGIFGWKDGSTWARTIEMTLQEEVLTPAQVKTIVENVRSLRQRIDPPSPLKKGEVENTKRLDNKRELDSTKESNPAFLVPLSKENLGGSRSTIDEQTLRQSEAFFRSLSEGSPIGIFCTNEQGQWIYTNPRCQLICGFTFTEALGNGWQRFTHPDDLEKFRQKWQANTQINAQTGIQIHTTNILDDQEVIGEIRFQRRDGSTRLCSIRTAVIAYNEELKGYIGTIEDITESHAIAQMKNEFISIVSHELRTPLTAIRGSLGLLANGIYDKKPDRAKRMLQIAATQTDRLVRLVNDILDLERLESGQVTLVKQCCDTTALMLQSVDTLRAEADRNNITLSVIPLDIQVWAAPDSIIQTLTNLLSNAIKFSKPNSTIWLTIESQPYLARPTALFEVKDQGRGIPADQLEKVFEQFQQVDVSDSREKGGTGLGLAICRSIIQQHGGQIWVESVLGVGSSFYFTLPLAPDPTIELDDAIDAIEPIDV